LRYCRVFRYRALPAESGKKGVRHLPVSSPDASCNAFWRRLTNCGLLPFVSSPRFFSSSRSSVTFNFAGVISDMVGNRKVFQTNQTVQCANAKLSLRVSTASIVQIGAKKCRQTTKRQQHKMAATKHARHRNVTANDTLKYK